MSKAHDRRSIPAHRAPERIAERLERLKRILQEMGAFVVAFSGGVDSTLLLKVAADTAGVRCVAVTTHSAATPPQDLDEARSLARAFGVRHVIVETDELATPGYAENTANRCYLCKQTLFPICFDLAARDGVRWVADGVNTDDLLDFRPGLTAAVELGVRHPLVEADLSKTDIRALSRRLALPTAEKPASPCLASRFPYGTPITREGLARVARAEAALRNLGFSELRVRCLGDAARVEIGTAEHGRLARADLRSDIVETVRTAGFLQVEISPEPFRSGSLNDALGFSRRASDERS